VGGRGRRARLRLRQLHRPDRDAAGGTPSGRWRSSCALVAVLLFRKSPWSEGSALLGAVAGAGLPLLVIAGLQWSAWHHRIAGDNTPNPFYWGGVGLCFLVAGVVAFAVATRRR